MNPILIVDDEAAIAMLVRRILTEAGYRCQAAVSYTHLTLPTTPYV